MNHNHKITLFLPSLNEGGAEKVFINLCEDFIKRGYVVELILYKIFGDYLHQIPGDVHIVPLGAKTPIGALWALIKWVRREKPACILSALPEANLLNIAARFCTKARYRCIISEHTILSENLRIYRYSVFHQIKHVLVRMLYKCADQIIVVSKAAAEDTARYCKASANKIKVIYNPLYSLQLIDMAKTNPDHPWLAADKETRPYAVLLSVGRFVPEKDHITLLEAFDILRKERPLKLLLLGKGPYEESIRKHAAALGLADEHIDFGGFVQNPYAYMAHADLLVLHSTHEGFGNVLVEAMAVGTPVVSTKAVGGITEILEYGKWGPCVPVRDPLALAEAISQTLDFPPHASIDYQKRASDFSISAASTQYLQSIFSNPA